jgi:hypothetical protein
VNTDEIFKRLAARANQFRFGPGVVGKTTALSLAVMLVLAAGMYRSEGNPYVIAGLAIAALVFATFVILKQFKFAEKNPAAALLEGAHLIEWRHMDMATQDFPNAPSSPSSKMIEQSENNG